MKNLSLLIGVLVMIFVLCLPTYGQWQCQYATQDDENNGTSRQTSSVAVLAENTFVALVHGVNWTGDTSRVNYLVGYVNADCNTGRTQTIPYNPDALFTTWGTGSDTVRLNLAWQIAATISDGLVYVANNDPEHNILVFRSTPTGIQTTNYRMKTGTRNIFAIATDQNGFVYVCVENATGSKDVMVFNKVTTGTWATTHNDQPIYTINLPPGTYRGIAASPGGKLVFVSSYSDRKILKFVRGATGYVQDATFNWSVAVSDTIPGTAILDPAGKSFQAQPMGLAYMPVNNILLAGVYTLTYSYGSATVPPPGHIRGNVAVRFGKIYLINPNDGKLAGTSTGDPMADTIDIAAWNFTKLGGYSTRGTACEAAGYASPFDVDVDEAGNVYTVSYWDWAVEKWSYFPMLPAITLTTYVRDETDPILYFLSQNYPNPFNPQTNIDFSIQHDAEVELKVFNELGQEVAIVLKNELTAGGYTATFDASGLASGVYYYTLKAVPKDGTAGVFIETKKMIVLR